MRYDDLYATLRQQFEARYGEPIEAHLLVHRSPDQPGARGPGRLFASGPAKAMAINNHLCLTPTAIHLAALGGRTGVKPKGHVITWDRRTALVEAQDAERSEWFHSYITSYDYAVHALRISGPEGTLVVDVMRQNHLADPEPEIRCLLTACGRSPNPAG